MGNRAVIQFGRDTDTAVGLYLHWNGGIESVKAFLDFAKEAGVRTGDDYTVARVAQIIGNFFGGTTSVGVGRAVDLDRENGDNGTYIVEGLEIVALDFRPEYRAEDTWDADYYEGVFGECYEKSGAFFGLTERPASDPMAPMIGPEMLLESAE